MVLEVRYLYVTLSPLLVCDLKSNTLTQLTPGNIEQMKFQITHQSPLACQLISGMTFIEHYDMLVLTSKESKQIQGIKWPRGDTMWQYDGMIGNIPLNPHDVSNTKDGRVFVANGNNLLTLDAGDGALSNIQFKTQTQPIKKVAYCNHKVAIRDGTFPDQTTCYRSIPVHPGFIVLNKDT